MNSSSLTVMSEPSLDAQFGDLFDLLDAEQRHGVRQIIASSQHEGLVPDRLYVRNLVDFTRGAIDHAEYRRRSHAWARDTH